MNSYTKPLKVCDVDGKKINASISKNFKKVRITVPFLKEVEEDKPSFSKDGKISFMCDIKNYQKAIVKLTQYIEDLFLKELQNADLRSSIKSNVIKGRDKKSDTLSNTTEVKGARSMASVHVSTRGEKSTESIRRREPSIKMDKSDNPSIKGQS